MKTEEARRQAAKAMVVRETVMLGNRYGLHARAACRFVETCKQFQSKVSVSKDGVTVDGKSILEVLTLGAEHGCTVDIEIVGEDDAGGGLHRQ